MTHRTSRTTGTLKRTRLREVLNIAEGATDQKWTYERLLEFLDEHHIEIVYSQGQPNQELVRLGGRGSEALLAADVENLLNFWTSTAVQS